MTQEPMTRTERGRQYRLDDALAAARGLLAERGVDGVTMTAVARQLGVSGPALYQYFDGRTGLLRATYDDVMDDLLAFLGETVARQDPDDLAAQVHAGTHAIFAWCRGHKHEFDLLMGSSFRKVARASEGVRETIAQRLGGAWVPTFERIWRSGVEFRADDEIPAPLREQLVAYREVLLRDHPGAGPGFPLGAVYVLYKGWRMIFGLLCMVAYDQIDYVFGDFEAVFADLMDDLFTLIGIPPSDGVRLAG
ncbi:TetR/AcrR family transcriptional regulator [Myceligenerans crystallogenes]|uniref:TetR/AcrR family transcriptional regulator n=1 Tax=Myceligenerans crystallogenes TaxID=316335 RepID=A0ABP4ZU65_9MICO